MFPVPVDLQDNVDGRCARRVEPASGRGPRMVRWWRRRRCSWPSRSAGTASGPTILRLLQEEIDRLDQGLPELPRYEPPLNPNRAGLKSWLVRNGISTPIPSQLRIDRPTGAYLVNAGGRKVPVLELRSGPAVSRVFLLRARILQRRLASQALRR